MVMPASRISKAISLGVRWRLAPSTIAIMRSRKLSPGLAVMRMTSHRKYLRATGDGAAVAAAFADHWRVSPVMADSSTEATPSITSPSAGNVVASLNEYDVAFVQIGGGDDCQVRIRDLGVAVWARVSGDFLVRRSASLAPCRGPRPLLRRNWRTAR